MSTRNVGEVTACEVGAAGHSLDSKQLHQALQQQQQHQKQQQHDTKTACGVGGMDRVL
jgi:hypothetical protein